MLWQKIQLKHHAVGLNDQCVTLAIHLDVIDLETCKNTRTS